MTDDTPTAGDGPVPVRPILAQPLLTRPILAGIWFGLFAGYVEYFARSAFQTLFHVTLHRDPYAIWLMPVVNAVLFGLLGACFSVALKIVRRRWMERLMVFVFGLLAFLSLTSVTNKIHEWAWAILAFGLATALCRHIVENPEKFSRVVKRSLPLAAAFIAASILWTFALPRWTEKQAFSDLPPVAATQPNVLLVVLDTVPAKRMSLYGYERTTTPNLDVMAEKSRVFDHAYATAPWTLPSHASMFTGRQSYELETDYEMPLGDRYPTLAEYLRRHGYATAGFAANWHYCVPEFGLTRGFTHYEGPRRWPERMLLVSYWSGRITRFIHDRALRRVDHFGRKDAAEINDRFLSWLNRRPKRPFFAFLNYMDTHTQYVPPPEYQNHFGTKMTNDPGLRKYWYRSDYVYSAEERQRIVDTYDSCLAYLDAELGKLFDQLKQRGLDQNTIVIVVGDHGEMLGEHDLFEHANCLFSEVVRVPLMIRVPGTIDAGTGSRHGEPVSIAAIPATVTDLLSLPSGVFPGVSLVADDLGPGKSERQPVYFEVKRNPFAQVRKTPASDGDMRGLVDGNMYYIKNADGSDEVYDIEQDPNQASDLSDTVAGRAVAERSRHVLENLLRHEDRPE